MRQVRGPTQSASVALLAAAFAALATTACGASVGPRTPFGDPPGAPPQGAAITVDNVNTRYSDLVIYLIPDSGVRRRLGSVRLNERKSFPVQAVNFGGEFLLLADELGGREIRSRRFVLDRGDLLQWDLSINIVSYGRRTGG